VVVEVDAERIVGWTIVSAQEGRETVSTITIRRFRHVPVVKEGRLTGPVSIGDVVKSRMSELTFERDQLDSYVHSGQSLTLATGSLTSPGRPQPPRQRRAIACVGAPGGPPRQRSQADPGHGDGRRLRRPSRRCCHEVRRAAPLRV
jgi:hypothetical protein